MEMTPEMIIEIRNEVFGDKEWPFLKERLYALYKKAMELAPSSEKEVILSACEKAQGKSIYFIAGKVYEESVH